MTRYYVNNNAQANGDHEVHEDGCSWLNLVISIKDLGQHDHCNSAVSAARAFYPKANGCYYCATECHTI